jgi:hypothetical protein
MTLRTYLAARLRQLADSIDAPLLTVDAVATEPGDAETLRDTVLTKDQFTLAMAAVSLRRAFRNDSTGLA